MLVVAHLQVFKIIQETIHPFTKLYIQPSPPKNFAVVKIWKLQFSRIGVKKFWVTTLLQKVTKKTLENVYQP